PGPVQGRAVLPAAAAGPAGGARLGAAGGEGRLRAGGAGDGGPAPRGRGGGGGAAAEGDAGAGGADPAAAAAAGRRGRPAWSVRARLGRSPGPGEPAGGGAPQRRALRGAARAGPRRRGGRRPGDGHRDLEPGVPDAALFGRAAAVRPGGRREAVAVLTRRPARAPPCGRVSPFPPPGTGRDPTRIPRTGAAPLPGPRIFFRETLGEKRRIAVRDADDTA